MSKILLVGSRPRGEHRWPVIVRDSATRLLTGGISVGSYTELESLAMQQSGDVHCPQMVRDQMIAAGVGPTPLSADEDAAPMLPRADKLAE
jgi:hypothetical protein